MEQDVLGAFWAQVRADPDLAAQEITARMEGREVYLTGTCATWDQVVRCGHIAGGLPGVKGVVNDLKLRG
jgi:osmotically-inducible protein OsmY